mmetsp:Transcript_72550/g.183669  ORF Transcript_72550/g.183669 Transcript_72550/m.183669 type:complete len:350 (-) Transcript_72550:70-1119(-)
MMTSHGIARFPASKQYRLRRTANQHLSFAHDLRDLGHELVVVPVLLQGRHAVLLDVFEDGLQLRVVFQIVELARLPEPRCLGLDGRVVHGNVLQVAAHDIARFLRCRLQVVGLHRELLAGVNEPDDEAAGALEGLALISSWRHDHGLLAVELRLGLQTPDDNHVSRRPRPGGARHSAPATHAGHATHAWHSSHRGPHGLRAASRLGELPQNLLILLPPLDGLHAVLLNIVEVLLHLRVLLELLHSGLDLNLPRFHGLFLRRIGHDILELGLNLLHVCRVLHVLLHLGLICDVQSAAGDGRLPRRRGGPEGHKAPRGRQAAAGSGHGDGAEGHEAAAGSAAGHRKGHLRM